MRGKYLLHSLGVVVSLFSICTAADTTHAPQQAIVHGSEFDNLSRQQVPLINTDELDGPQLPHKQTTLSGIEQSSSPKPEPTFGDEPSEQDLESPPEIIRIFASLTPEEQPSPYDPINDVTVTPMTPQDGPDPQPREQEQDDSGQKLDHTQTTPKTHQFFSLEQTTTKEELPNKSPELKQDVLTGGSNFIRTEDGSNSSSTFVEKNQVPPISLAAQREMDLRFLFGQNTQPTSHPLQLTVEEFDRLMGSRRGNNAPKPGPDQSFDHAYSSDTDGFSRNSPPPNPEWRQAYLTPAQSYPPRPRQGENVNTRRPRQGENLNTRPPRNSNNRQISYPRPRAVPRAPQRYPDTQTVPLPSDTSQSRSSLPVQNGPVTNDQDWSVRPTPWRPDTPTTNNDRTFQTDRGPLPNGQQRDFLGFNDGSNSSPNFPLQPPRPSPSFLFKETIGNTEGNRGTNLEITPAQQPPWRRSQIDGQRGSSDALSGGRRRDLSPNERTRYPSFSQFTTPPPNRQNLHFRIPASTSRPPIQAQSRQDGRELLTPSQTTPVRPSSPIWTSGPFENNPSNIPGQTAQSPTQLYSNGQPYPVGQDVARPVQTREEILRSLRTRHQNLKQEIISRNRSYRPGSSNSLLDQTRATFNQSGVRGLPEALQEVSQPSQATPEWPFNRATNRNQNVRRSFPQSVSDTNQRVPPRSIGGVSLGQGTLYQPSVNSGSQPTPQPTQWQIWNSRRESVPPSRFENRRNEDCSGRDDQNSDFRNPSRLQRSSTFDSRRRDGDGTKTYPQIVRDPNVAFNRVQSQFPPNAPRTNLFPRNQTQPITGRSRGRAMTYRERYLQSLRDYPGAYSGYRRTPTRPRIRADDRFNYRSNSRFTNGRTNNFVSRFTTPRSVSARNEQQFSNQARDRSISRGLPESRRRYGVKQGRLRGGDTSPTSQLGPSLSSDQISNERLQPRRVSDNRDRSPNSLYENTRTTQRLGADKIQSGTGFRDLSQYGRSTSQQNVIAPSQTPGPRSQAPTGTASPISRSRFGNRIRGTENRNTSSSDFSYIRRAYTDYLSRSRAQQAAQSSPSTARLDTREYTPTPTRARVENRSSGPGRANNHYLPNGTPSLLAEQKQTSKIAIEEDSEIRSLLNGHHDFSTEDVFIIVDDNVPTTTEQRNKASTTAQTFDTVKMETSQNTQSETEDTPFQNNKSGHSVSPTYATLETETEGVLHIEDEHIQPSFTPDRQILVVDPYPPPGPIPSPNEFSVPQLGFKSDRLSVTPWPSLLLRHARSIPQITVTDRSAKLVKDIPETETSEDQQSRARGNQDTTDEKDHVLRDVSSYPSALQNNALSLPNVQQERPASNSTRRQSLEMTSTPATRKDDMTSSNGETGSFRNKTLNHVEESFPDRIQAHNETSVINNKSAVMINRNVEPNPNPNPKRNIYKHDDDEKDSALGKSVVWTTPPMKSNPDNSDESRREDVFAKGLINALFPETVLQNALTSFQSLQDIQIPQAQDFEKNGEPSTSDSIRTEKQSTTTRSPSHENSSSISQLRVIDSKVDNTMSSDGDEPRESVPSGQPEQERQQEIIPNDNSETSKGIQKEEASIVPGSENSKTVVNTEGALPAISPYKSSLVTRSSATRNDFRVKTETSSTRVKEHNNVETIPDLLKTNHDDHTPMLDVPRNLAKARSSYMGRRMWYSRNNSKPNTDMSPTYIVLNPNAAASTLNNAQMLKNGRDNGLNRPSTTPSVSRRNPEALEMSDEMEQNDGDTLLNKKPKTDAYQTTSFAYPIYPTSSGLDVSSLSKLQFDPSVLSFDQNSRSLLRNLRPVQERKGSTSFENGGIPPINEHRGYSNKLYDPNTGGYFIDLPVNPRNFDPRLFPQPLGYRSPYQSAFSQTVQNLPPPMAHYSMPKGERNGGTSGFRDGQGPHYIAWPYYINTPVPVGFPIDGYANFENKFGYELDNSLGGIDQEENQVGPDEESESSHEVENDGAPSLARQNNDDSSNDQTFNHGHSSNPAIQTPSPETTEAVPTEFSIRNGHTSITVQNQQTKTRMRQVDTTQSSRSAGMLSSYRMAQSSHKQNTEPLRRPQTTARKNWSGTHHNSQHQGIVNRRGELRQSSTYGLSDSQMSFQNSQRRMRIADKTQTLAEEEEEELDTAAIEHFISKKGYRPGSRYPSNGSKKNIMVDINSKYPTHRNRYVSENYYQLQTKPSSNYQISGNRQVFQRRPSQEDMDEEAIESFIYSKDKGHFTSQSSHPFLGELLKIQLVLSSLGNQNFGTGGFNNFISLIYQFSPGPSFTYGGLRVQYFFTLGDSARAVRHFKLLPLKNVRQFGSMHYEGKLFWFKVKVCSSCFLHKFSMIEFRFEPIPYFGVIRRFVYLS